MVQWKNIPAHLIPCPDVVVEQVSGVQRQANDVVENDSPVGYNEPILQPENAWNETWNL